MFNYCPNCGTKDAVIEHNTTDYSCSKCDWRYWNNPHSATAIVFLKPDGQVLVSKRAIEPRKGTYDMPGGFLNYGEDPYQGAIREIKEETGIEIILERLHLLEVKTVPYTPNTTSVDIFFVVDVAQDEHLSFVPQDDSAALEWKPLSFLDSGEFDPRYTGVKEKLQEYLLAKAV